MGTEKAKRGTYGRGTIEERGPRTWVVRLSHRRDPETGKRVREARTVHGTRRDAERFLAALVSRKDLRGPTPTSGGRITLDAWVKQHIGTGLSRKTGAPLSERTRVGQLDLWSRYSSPALRGMALRDVTTAALTAHVAELRDRANTRNGRRLAPRTVQIYFNILRASLGAAAAQGLIPANPATGVVVHGGGITSKVGQALTRDEIRAFLDYAPFDRLAALWTVAAYTGARPGEVLGLFWEDFDEDAKRLHIRRALVRVKGHHSFEGCKAGSERMVPLAPPVVEALKRHRARQREERMALGPDRWVDPRLVFTNAIGAPLEAHNVARAFRARLKAAKVRPVRWYDLRHSAGTHLMAQTGNAKTVAGILGHRDVRTTLQSYTHPDAEAHADAVEKLSNFLG